MSKLGIASGTCPAPGSVRRGRHGGHAEQHRNGLTKRRSYGSLERSSTTDTLQTPRSDNAGSTDN